MKISNLIARLNELTADCGDVDVKVVSDIFNGQEALGVRKVDYVSEIGAAVIFTEDAA